MNKTKGIIAFIISLAVLAFAGYVIMFGIGDRGQAKYITQGLDLKGGVYIVYQADKANPTEEEMNAAVSMLQERVAYKGWYDAEVSFCSRNEHALKRV